MPYGKTRFGDTIYAGEGDGTPAPVSPDTTPVFQKGAIGRGEWSAQIATRGGGSVIFQVPWTAISVSYVLNNTGQARVALNTDAETWSACCEIVAVTEPFEHELILWRDEQLAFAGPVVSLSSESGDILAKDLSYWMEVRFLDDMHSVGDSSDVFRAVFENGYNKDTSPNIQLSTRRSGVETGMDVRGVEFRKASDMLRSLAGYGIDWTVVGRTILAGGKEVFENGGERLLVHDAGVLSAGLSKEGTNLATDLALFGARENSGKFPVTGRAQAGEDRYGLVQRSVTDLLVTTTTAADNGALARVQAMQPTPRRIRVVAGEGAAYEFADLIPGRQMDVRLYNTLPCLEVEEVMRLQQVDVEVGDNEEVTHSLIPLGVTEDD